jgi:replicative DNA helicase
MSIQDQPHNMDAERAVIAAALRRVEAADLYALEPLDFFVASHQQIYRSILATRRADTLSVVAVADDLRRRGELDRIGGLAALANLPGDAWTPSYETDACAAIVRRCAIRRAMIAAGGRIVTMGYAEQADLDEQIGEAHTLLTAATTRASAQNGIAIGDALDSWYDMTTNEDEGGRFATGLPDLDDLTGGVWGSDLVVLAAMTGVGKSALALSIADHLTAQAVPVIWFSMEMPRAQLINRLVSGYTCIDAARLRKRQIKPSELPAISAAMDEYRGRPLVIDDTPGRTLAQIRAVTQQHRARRGPIGLVVVDHMGLMRASTRYAGNRVHEVSELSRGLKELAMELNAPVLALHQFNRAGGGEDDTSKVPLLSWLKDSSSVEQDADSVWLLHRPGVRSTIPLEQKAATLYVAKQRNGPIGAVALSYDPATTQYRSIARYRTAEGY